MVLLDGFLNGFLKFKFFVVKICILIWDFLVIFENYSMRMLSIPGNGFASTSDIFFMVWGGGKLQVLLVQPVPYSLARTQLHSRPDNLRSTTCTSGYTHTQA